MNEQDERFADSGLPIEERRLTRRAALKLGAVGVIGAAAATYLPGRARAGGISPVPCRPGQGFTCSKNNFTHCNSPSSGCGCAIQYTGHKVYKVQSYCTDFNVCCSALNTCFNGQGDCPPNTICSATTCCTEPVCMPACGANYPAASCCLTPKGQAPCTCTTGGTCNTNFTQCGTGVDCGPGAGCFCFTTAEGGGTCGENVFCNDYPTCQATSDCASGQFCSKFNGCDCSGSVGICVPTCGHCAPTKGTKPAGSGMTATNVRY
jgi:hypothetical protein